LPEDIAKEYLGASYQMSDGETIEREVKALVALHGLHPLKRAMIITYEDEGEIMRDGLRIEIKPAWKWVLEGL
jgi:predicted AAA+ superfamily ATPase